MFESNLLKGKTIIVTGGGTGLGKSMAHRFCELGANVVIASRKMDVLEKTAEELRETGASVLPVQTDVRTMEETEKLVKKTVDEFGKVDILLNNAALSGAGGDVVNVDADQLCN